MIARVVVDTPLPHLDRLFDYAVPDDLAADVREGCRVKVRFAGRLVEAFVVQLAETSEHGGTLAPLAKVVSSEVVLTPEVAALCRAVADRWAGSLNDVLRLAIPPRQARVEAHPRSPAPRGATTEPDASLWAPWPAGARLLAALARGESPRACWSALPAHDPARIAAQAVLATLQSGRGAVVCVPDNRDLAHWDEVFREVLGEGSHVVLSAAQKPAARYRAFLALARGEVRVVLGTRAAAFAPVDRLGMVAMFDDGDDLFAEPRAPYVHAREVLLMRALQQNTAVLLGGNARSVEAQALVQRGWCAELSPEPVTRRRMWPTVEVSDGDAGAPARLPRAVFTAIRQCDGPVLVQVPRRGYRTSLACQQCRASARCTACAGPLEQRAGQGGLQCRWCTTQGSQPWTCPSCGGHEVRAPTVGHLRTAEEYAAAFPDREIVTSGGSAVLDRIEPGPALVLATPGAEPSVHGGYRLVVLMDTGLMLMRDDVRVVEEAHRRWFNALALAAEPAAAVAVGEPASLQSLVRADPVGFAQRELAARTEAHLPPSARLAVLDGDDDVLKEWAARQWTPHTDVLGPIDADSGTRLILRAPLREGADLARLLHVAQAERSADKLPVVRVRIDPMSF